MLWLILALVVNGQGYVDQDKVEPLLNSQRPEETDLTMVDWVTYPYKKFKKGDPYGPWTKLKMDLDSLPGNRSELRLEIVELANRVTSDKLKQGRTLFVPNSFPENYLAYAPYPLNYSAASEIPKLFIIDKFTQTFGAYESGRLVRWGILSSGSRDRLTPTRKYHFHWKAKYRQSSAAPPGEVWEMYYMVNFLPRIGLHVHQYSLPMAYPVSHGCVRIAMADAVWNYYWSVSTTRKQKGTPVWVINHNPKGIAAHWEVGKDGQVHSLVRLP